MLPHKYALRLLRKQQVKCIQSSRCVQQRMLSVPQIVREASEISQLAAAGRQIDVLCSTVEDYLLKISRAGIYWEGRHDSESSPLWPQWPELPFVKESQHYSQTQAPQFPPAHGLFALHSICLGNSLNLKHMPADSTESDSIVCREADQRDQLLKRLREFSSSKVVTSGACLSFCPKREGCIGTSASLPVYAKTRTFVRPYSISSARGKRGDSKRTRVGQSHLGQNVPQIADLIDELANKLFVFAGSQEEAPPEAIANENSMLFLRKLLETVSPPMKEYPKAGMTLVELYLAGPHTSQLPDQTSGLRRVAVQFRTSGGHCQRLVEAAMMELLNACGLPSIFVWGEGYWELSSALHIKTRPVDSPAAPAPALPPGSLRSEEVLVSSASAHPVNQLQAKDSSLGQVKGDLADLPSEGSVEDERASNAEHSETQVEADVVVRAYDMALEAIASVPWHLEADQARVKVEVLQPMEEDGWQVRRATERIWAGERNLAELTAGIDAISAQLVNSILFHTRKFERNLGEPIPIPTGGAIGRVHS